MRNKVDGNYRKGQTKEEAQTITGLPGLLRAVLNQVEYDRHSTDEGTVAAAAEWIVSGLDEWCETYGLDATRVRQHMGWEGLI